MTDDAYPGEKERRTNQQTGTTILVIDGRKNKLFPYDRLRWVLLCLEHQISRRYRTLADARIWNSQPAAWCAGCLDILTDKESADGPDQPDVPGPPEQRGARP